MLHLHSILRWAVFILLIIALINSLIGLIKKKDFTSGNGKIGLYLMMVTHMQLILGFILYFTRGWMSMGFSEAMSNPGLRFWKVEHIFGMLIAITLITIGRIRTKKLTESKAQHKNAVIYYGIALVIIIFTIPWDMSRLF